jgi:hypothetical protein
MTTETALTYQVYVTPILATAAKDFPPGQSRSTWSPIEATFDRLFAAKRPGAVFPGRRAGAEDGRPRRRQHRTIGVHGPIGRQHMPATQPQEAQP